MVFNLCFAILMAGLCFLIIRPILTKFSLSLMSNADLYDSSVLNVPRTPVLDNYRVAGAEMGGYLKVLGRTLGVVLAGALLQVASCTLAGYGFARHNFPLKNFLFICVLFLIVIPPQTVMAPLYLNFRFFDIFGVFRLFTGGALNLLNNPVSYLLLYATGMGLKGGLYIFIMRQYFRGVPKELEEAAWVDGCGRLRTFVQIILPGAGPMVTSCFLFSFVWQWTDSFYFSLLVPNLQVISTGLSKLAVFDMYNNNLDPYAQAVLYTGILMALVPVALVYLFAQRAFVMSLSHTGIKM